MTLAILSTIVVITFTTRLIPRLILPDSVASDSYFHMAMARVIRENNHRIPDIVPRVMVCPRYTYPYLFHWLLSFIPERHLMVAERLVSPVIDTLYVLVTFLFAWEIDRTGRFTNDPTAIALWTSVLVAMSPALLSVGAGPRAYNGTPRTLGEFFFLIYISATIIFWLTGATIWFLLAAIGVAALSITSKFGNQVIVLLSIGSALAGHFEPSLAAIGGYLLSVVFTRGRALKVIDGQIAHSKFYFKYLQQRFLHPARRTPRQYVDNAASSIRTGFANPLRFVNWFFQEPYFFHYMLVNYPQGVGIAVLLLAGEPLVLQYFSSNPRLHLILTVISVSFAVSLLTSFRPLMFLGEAHRYAEHTVMLQVLIFVVMVETVGLSAPLWIILGYSAAAYIFSVRTYVMVYRDFAKLKGDMPTLIAPIDQEDTRIYGLGQVYWPLLFFVRKARILFYGGNFDERLLDTDDWVEVFGNYPFPGIPLAKLTERYGIDYVVASRDTVKRYEDILNDRSFSEGRFRAISKSGNLLLFYAETGSGVLQVSLPVADRASRQARA